ncbi:MAG: hypothetical protein KGZ61_08585 [Sandarakinorhabdus sp.]|nr:hypothetical protein [Sandarakinorhabdus sp.]
MLFVAAIHALLLLLLLSLAPPVLRKQVADMIMFNISEAPAPRAETQDTPAVPEAAPEAQQAPRQPETLAESAPAPPDQPVVEIPPEVAQAVDLAPLPPVMQPAPPVVASARRVFGPPAPPRRGPTGDSERVEGTGPGGEPLYAASWYREPYPDELRGFLSAAQGPGWGLIACRTVPGYRVEDCVIVGEHPPGSRIANSVLAAAWQFRVRPPQIGGRPQVGEWVRIRIDYYAPADRNAMRMQSPPSNPGIRHTLPPSLSGCSWAPLPAWSKPVRRP